MSTTTHTRTPVISLNASLQEAIAEGKALVLTVGQYGYYKLTIEESK